MMFKLNCCLIYFLLFALITTTQCEDGSNQNSKIKDDTLEPEDILADSKWIHFNDMENFDVSRRSHRKGKSNHMKNQKPQAFGDMGADSEAINHMKCLYKAKNYDQLQTVVHSYMKRYVNLFLSMSQLQDREINPEEDEIRADVEIIINAKDLLFLKNFSKQQRHSKSEEDLMKLDTIMGSVINLKTRSMYENLVKASSGFSLQINVEAIFQFLNYPGILPLLFTVGVIIILRYFQVRKLFYYTILVCLNAHIVWEGYKKYFRLREEAKMENHVRMLQREHNIPVNCNPASMSWRDRFYSWFVKDPCLEYHHALIKDSVEEVDLLKCILETYKFYITEYGFGLFATVTRRFSEDVTGFFPSPFNYIFYTVFVIIFVGFTLWAISSYFGARFHLSFLYGLFSTGIEHGDRGEPVRVAPVQQADPAPPPQYNIQVIQQLPQPLLDVFHRLADFPIAVESKQIEVVADPDGEKENNSRIETVGDEASVVKEKKASSAPSSDVPNDELESNAAPDEIKSAEGNEAKLSIDSDLNIPVSDVSIDEIHADIEKLKETIRTLKENVGNVKS